MHGLLLCVILLPSIYAVEYRHSAVLNDGAYILEWAEDRDDMLVFRVTARTLGWVGFGLSQSGSMAGADIVVAGVDDATGDGYISDRHATANAFPELDEQQDYALLEAKQNETHTVVVFERKGSTCDADDWKITHQTVKVLWAMHPKDAKSEDAFSRHSERGSKSLILKGGFPSKKQPLPDDAFPLDIQMKDVRIPEDKDTHYECRMFTIPDSVRASKHHLIRTELNVDPASRDHVHHMIIYLCPDDVDIANNTQEDCMRRPDGSRPRLRSCSGRYIYGWAVGGEYFQDFPEDTGYPLGAGESGSIMMEIHYDNSIRRKNVARDNTFLRLWLTTSLRKHDFATISFGLPVSKDLLIPPGQSSFKFTTFCTDECMQRIPPEGLNLYSGFLHQHLAGKAMSLRVIRDGVELKPIFEDMNYDFNYQQGHILDKTFKLLPTDTVIFDCYFNTKDRNFVTYGGHETSDEMCLAFIGYWPRLNRLLYCTSSPSMETYKDALGIQSSVSSKGEFEMRGKKSTLHDYLTHIDFGRASNPDVQTPTAKKLEQALRDGKQNMKCRAYSDSDPGKATFEDRHIPAVEKKYKPTDAC